jgi:uncharacterized protein
MSQSLSAEAIEEVLASHYIGHLACSLDDTPYVVPITYYYDAERNSLVGYTAEGKKVDVLRKNPKVSVAISHIDNLSHWKSVILEGTFQEIEGSESLQVLQLLITKLEGLINEEGKQHVEQIRDMARANDAKSKVIYRIQIDRKNGRFEAGDFKLDI